MISEAMTKIPCKLVEAVCGVKFYHTLEIRIFRFPKQALLTWVYLKSTVFSVFITIVLLHF